MAAPSRTILPTATTIARALVVARWLTLLWMVGVVVVSSERAAIDHPLAAWSCVVAVAGVAAWTTWAVRIEPARLFGNGFLVIEASLAIGLSVIDGWVFEPGHVFEVSQSLATQYPLIAVISIGLARGPIIAGALGLLIGPAEWAGAALNEVGDWNIRDSLSLVATSMFYAAAGVVFGWQAQLVQHADATLEQRVRAAVGRAARHHDAAAHVPISVSVIDTAPPPPTHVADAIAAAVGEAVANALEHAGPTRIVVFIETDDDGDVFASVRDDGCGFDVDVDRTGHGVDESIVARINDVGGRTEVVSSPTTGTEVRVWST